MLDNDTYIVSQKLGIQDAYTIYKEENGEPGEAVLKASQDVMKMQDRVTFTNLETNEQYEIEANRNLDIKGTEYTFKDPDGNEMGTLKKESWGLVNQKWSIQPDGMHSKLMLDQQQPMGVIRTAANTLVHERIAEIVPVSYDVLKQDNKVGTVDGSLSLTDEYTVDATETETPTLLVLSAAAIDALENN